MITNPSKQAVKDSIEKAKSRLKAMKAQADKHEREFNRLSAQITQLEQNIELMKDDIK